MNLFYWWIEKQIRLHCRKLQYFFFNRFYPCTDTLLHITMHLFSMHTGTILAAAKSASRAAAALPFTDGFYTCPWTSLKLKKWQSIWDSRHCIPNLEYVIWNNGNFCLACSLGLGGLCGASEGSGSCSSWSGSSILLFDRPDYCSN